MTNAFSMLPRFYDAGEAALVVEFGTTVDPAINARVLAVDHALTELNLPGVWEIVPTYRSLTVHYDPLALDRDALRTTVIDIASADRSGENLAAGRLWVLPCCYDSPFGEDVDEVSEIAHLNRDALVEAHASAEYRVYMYGFAPGYAYLGGLAKSLQIPRRRKPRPPHAASAVLIGGGLASITTFAMPTGWYVVGRTPFRLFDPRRSDPSLVQPGDSVLFRPISAEEFLDLDARISSGEVLSLEATNTEGIR